MISTKLSFIKMKASNIYNTMINHKELNKIEGKCNNSLSVNKDLQVEAILKLLLYIHKYSLLKKRSQNGRDL